ATTDFKNNTTATIGDNVEISALGNFALKADTQLSTSLNGYSDGGGLVAVISCDNTASATSTTSTTIGSRAKISGATVNVLATASTRAVRASPSAKGGGLFGGANANANSKINSRVTSTTGDGNIFNAPAGMDVRALNMNFRPSLHADALFIGLGGGHGDNK